MEANNYTIGYNNIQKNNKFKASLYYIDLKNEIYYDPSYMANPNSLNTNISKSHKYGVDLSDKIIVNQQFNAVLNYNYAKLSSIKTVLMLATQAKSFQE
jgi:iron complex outermembrane receptor protein